MRTVHLNQVSQQKENEQQYSKAKGCSKAKMTTIPAELKDVAMKKMNNPAK